MLGDYANFLEDNEELREAEAMFKRSVAAPGAAGTQYCNYAVMLTDQSRFDEAKPLYEKAWELDPCDAGVAYNLGCFHAKQGQRQEARRSPTQWSPSCVAPSLKLLLLGRQCRG